jgi:hypothetical protein
MARRRCAPRRQPSYRPALAIEDLEGRVVPTLLGQQLFPPDYPWNQNIASAPLAANSAAIIAHIGASIQVHPDWGTDNPADGSSPLYGIPFNVVHGNTTQKVNVVIDNYPDESDIVPVPIPANAVIEGDYENGPNPNGPGYSSGQRGDSHLIVWDEDNNIAYELYGAARPSDPVTMAGGPTNGQWHAAQESVWNMKTDGFRSLGWTSADAAGLSILAGLARPDEGLPASQGGQASIDHALRFTLPSGDVNPQYIYPASHVVSESSGSTKLPFGARLRLQNTPAVNNLISTLGPEAQIIARAMQQYGLVLADIGSSMYVTGTSAAEDANNDISLTWDMNDVLGLRSITAGDFDVVDLTPAVTGLSSSSGLPGNSITITGHNFSGAAGHLTVLFGSTPASSITFVDDSHISAVIPSGSGTVDIQVQSGVNETDPNNPSDNVNNPIFGYGISAISAADQFTYQIISGANSTDSFATSTVVAGSGDVLTIVLKNTTGNPVSGVSASAFTLSLSGGASAGTFGAVTETATKGTYTATFSGITAGTASTLAVSVGGIALATTPGVTVVPAAASTFVLDGLAAQVTAGVGAGLTVTARDAFGNVAAGYNGTIHFTSSDPAATLPSDYTFTGADLGIHSFTATLNSTGTESLTITDTVSKSLGVTRGNITVLPYPFASVQGVAIYLRRHQTFTRAVATFTTVTGTESPAAFTPAIDWGDGQSSAGTVGATSGGGFTVTGTHAYAQPGRYTVKITLAGPSAASTAVSAQASVGTADQLFVGQLYHDLLARAADPAGLAGWSGELDQAAATRQQVAAALVGSQEFETEEVQNLYQSILGRPADPMGLASWVAFLSRGGTYLQVETQLLASTEFFNKAGGSNATFLAALFEVALHRQIDAGGASTFGQALVNGTSRLTVAQRVLGSPEFDMDVVRGLYLQLLHRPADASGLQVFVGALQNGASTEQVMVSLAGSQEYAQNCDGAANLYYVQNLYADLLGRPLDPAGQATFVGGLDRTQLTRTQVVQDILNSNEYRTDVVQALYETELHRPADSRSLSGFTAFLAGGGTEEQIAANLAGSAEFFHDNGSTNAGFLAALYQDALGRPPDSAGLSTWLAALQNGSSRSQVAAAIFGSPEYYTVWLQSLYVRLLHRTADSTGLNQFVTALEHGTHDEAIIAALVESVEYFTR